MRAIWNLRFNEGGADCPPKPNSCAKPYCPPSRFNEGGADCPPKRIQPSNDVAAYHSFNEGGADCPPKPATPIFFWAPNLQLQ